ncbi:MAG: transporter substrate-binding domain-containing protein [Candidatus Acetothermia bacterium]
MKRNSVGIDIDIIREIAEVEGFNVEFVTSSWDSLIPMVNMGKADMTGGGMSITEKREEMVDFTEPYWFTEMAVLVREDSRGSVFSVCRYLRGRRHDLPRSRLRLFDVN